MLHIIKKLLLFVLKVFVLMFVATLAVKQIPELRYDFGPKKPVEILRLQDLTPDGFVSSVFVSIHGIPDFQYAFSYRRYGLTFTYFTLEPYGLHVVVRTHDRVTDEWNDLNRFLGRLRPFEKQPFSYRIQEILREKMNVEIPEDSYFLALDDVPKPSGWQIGALAFSGVLWVVLFYLFFLYRGTLKRPSATKPG